MSDALVSIVVTAYDVGRFVERAVESALAQDHPRTEVIVVDDGSTDDTGAILAGFGDRIRLVSRPNGGVSTATSSGVAIAGGDYIAFFDGDDVMPVDRISRQVAYLEANPAVGLVHGDMEVIDAEDRLVHPSFFAHGGIEQGDGDIYARLVRGNFVSGGASMVRASLIPRFHPIPEPVPWQDWWIVVRVAEVAQIGRAAGSVNRYRLHDANFGLQATGERRARSKRCEIECRRHILAHLSRTRASVVDFAACHAALEHHVAEIAAIDGIAPSQVVAVTDADRTRAAAAHAEALAAFADGRLEEAARGFVRVLGADPLHPARADLHHTLQLLAERGELESSGAPLPPDELALPGFVALATLAELEQRPALLAGFSAAFAPDDGATLVVVGDGDASALTSRMQRVLSLSGVDADASPDIVVVPAGRPDETARVAAAAHARLGTAAVAGAARLPAAANAEADVLRALAAAA